MESQKEAQTEIHLLDKSGTKVSIKAYKQRWLIMFIFMYYAGINSFQWIEYSGITNLVVRYYNVSTMAVDWTSTVYLLVYPILAIPAIYIIDKKGLRLTALLGCTGTLVGTALKVLSIRNDLFWIVLLGNTILAASSLLIICLPPKIASIWFKSDEVSTACSLGIFGTQMGCGIGYILPPFIVQDQSNIEDIGSQLKILCWLLALSMVPATVAVFLYFPDQPTLPPSKVQAALRENKSTFDSKLFLNSVKNLFSIKGFIIHFFAYGINGGVFSAIGTLLNQFILQFFKDSTKEVGYMGFILIISGMIGMLILGVLLDKSHKYKETAFGIYLFATISVIFLIFSLKYKYKVLTYVACILLGVTTNAYIMVGFEFGMELTFPAEESTVAGILLLGSQILGAIFTIALGYINFSFGALWSLFTQVVALSIGTIATAYVPNNLRRQDGFRQNNPAYEIKKASYHGSRTIVIE